MERKPKKKEKSTEPQKPKQKPTHQSKSTHLLPYYNLFRRSTFKPTHLRSKSQTSPQPIITPFTLYKTTHQYLSSTYNTSTATFNQITIDNLINSKNCHHVAIFKDYLIFDFIDEFLKRYYQLNETVERIPKIANYYKNYLKFFCNPIFRDFDVNNIVQSYGDTKAELYYNKNYGQKKKKTIDKAVEENGLRTIFDTTVKDSIDNHNLTQTTIKGDAMGVSNTVRNQANMKTNYKKAVYEEVSSYFHFNEPSVNSNYNNESLLLTRRSCEEYSLINILSKMTMQQGADTNQKYKPVVKNFNNIAGTNNNINNIKALKSERNTNVKDEQKIFKDFEEKIKKSIDLKSSTKSVITATQRLNSIEGKDDTQINSNLLRTSSNIHLSNHNNNNRFNSNGTKIIIESENKQALSSNTTNSIKTFNSNSTNFNTHTKSPFNQIKQSPIKYSSINEFKSLKITKSRQANHNNQHHGSNSNKIYSTESSVTPNKLSSILNNTPTLNFNKLSAKLQSAIGDNYDITTSTNFKNGTKESSVNNRISGKELSSTIGKKKSEPQLSPEAINDVMRITLSVYMDKGSRNRPSSNQNQLLTANTFANPQLAYNVLESARKATATLDKLSDINNFNININNQISINPNHIEIYNNNNNVDKRKSVKNKQNIYSNSKKESNLNNNNNNLSLKQFLNTKNQNSRNKSTTLYKINSQITKSLNEQILKEKNNKIQISSKNYKGDNKIYSSSSTVKLHSNQNNGNNNNNKNNELQYGKLQTGCSSLITNNANNHKDNCGKPSIVSVVSGNNPVNSGSNDLSSKLRQSNTLNLLGTISALTNHNTGNITKQSLNTNNLTVKSPSNNAGIGAAALNPSLTSQSNLYSALSRNKIQRIKVPSSSDFKHYITTNPKKETTKVNSNNANSNLFQTQYIFSNKYSIKK